jgi:alpha-D-ribose 1-methylphosphonate 5-triphosphate diphosphatase
MRHFLHARIDPNSNAILEFIDQMKELESLYLIIFNDQIPAQRQFTMEQQIELRSKNMGISAEEAEAMLLEQIERLKEINNRGQIQEAFKDRYVLGSHDDTTIEHVEEGKLYGAALSEMPTTMVAARKAKELGLWVCIGAPNYYRGGSHCGNLSCWEAMEEDLVDILCSDYHFPTMLASIVRMIDNGIDPSKAVNMVSLNPAKMLKFDAELGSIEVGKKADLVAFSSEKSFASVSYVFVDGIVKYFADYTNGVQPLMTVGKATGVLNNSL